MSETEHYQKITRHNEIPEEYWWELYEAAVKSARGLIKGVKEYEPEDAASEALQKAYRYIEEGLIFQDPAEPEPTYYKLNEKGGFSPLRYYFISMARSAVFDAWLKADKRKVLDGRFMDSLGVIINVSRGPWDKDDANPKEVHDESNNEALAERSTLNKLISRLENLDIVPGDFIKECIDEVADDYRSRKPYKTVTVKNTDDEPMKNWRLIEYLEIKLWDDTRYTHEALCELLGIEMSDANATNYKKKYFIELTECGQKKLTNLYPNKKISEL